LEVPLDAIDPDPLARLYREFLIAHDRVYGHATEAPWPSPAARPAVKKRDRPVLIAAASGFETISIYDRAALAAGVTIDGPAIIEQSDMTTVIPRGWRCGVGEGTRLLMEMR
jgi:N-methylhydantoinase A